MNRRSMNRRGLLKIMRPPDEPSNEDWDAQVILGIPALIGVAITYQHGAWWAFGLCVSLAVLCAVAFIQASINNRRWWRGRLRRHDESQKPT